MRTKKSIAYLSLFILAVSIALAVRLAHLQLIQGAALRLRAEDNRLKNIKIPSPRGIIYDRNGVPLVENKPYYYLTLSPDMIAGADLDAIAAFAGLTRPELEARIKSAVPLENIKLKGGLSFEDVARAEARLADYPALAVEADQVRHYLYGEVGSHIVGYLGRLNEKQARSEDMRDVPTESFIGQWGIERLYDGRLRGVPGIKAIEVNALGRDLRIVKDEPPIRGEDLYLSIDMEVQTEAEKAFGNRSGALVAVKVDTGEILALVSRPAFDPNLFAMGINYSDWRTLVEDEQSPMLNRAMQSQYPPGSVFKVVTAMAALETGAITPDTEFVCTGGISAGQWTFRCMKRTGHGRLALHEALVYSCDVYFYLAGRQAGIEAIADYARLLGVEEKSGLGLADEKKGVMPDPAWKQKTMRLPWYPGETFTTAIGQSYVLLTPIQTARLMAAVANGGKFYDLTLKRADGPVVPARIVDVKEKNLDEVRKALAGVVSEEGGTGWAARSKYVAIGGKTGTAQVIGSRDQKPGQFVAEKLRDHAWFAAFAPVEKPEIAVAVIVEHGGHGGVAAAPIAKKTIEAYLAREAVKKEEEKRKKAAAKRPRAILNTPSPEGQGLLNAADAPDTITNAPAVVPLPDAERPVPGAEDVTEIENSPAETDFEDDIEQGTP